MSKMNLSQADIQALTQSDSDHRVSSKITVTGFLTSMPSMSSKRPVKRSAKISPKYNARALRELKRALID